MGCDVLIVGAGNAAMCAALAARENGAEVTVLERAPIELRGGNSTFTAGAIRVAYNTLDDLLELLPELPEEEKANTDFGTYSEDQFFEDMGRVTQYHTDPDMAELLVRRSHATLKWMREKGIRFAPIYGRQAFKVEGKFKFWGGLTIEAWGGGPGLIEALHTIAQKQGVNIIYNARALSLISDDDGIHG
ncbi:MAG TPA: FAD-dependent oxidoreductase, partial [Candidatus Binataceae bacterium]|nr:FAD-dependent oxidoreductase [Candidatus Binataceae bacterium]